MSTPRKSSLGKKLVLAFGGLFGLLVLAAIVVPLVVDVDKYRPMIVSKADEMLNGRLELGKLGLSLWGRVKVDIDGLKLTDAKGRSVVEVKDASFDLPFLGLLTGHPEVRLHLVSPLVSVVKDKDGKMNALTLVKETPTAGGASGASAAIPGAQGTKTAAGGGKTEIPAIVMNSRLTFLLDHAKVSYKDAITGDTYDINDLNFRLEDVSPSSDMPFDMTANLDLLLQKRIKVNGPLVLNGNVKATSSGGAFEKAEAKVSLKLDGLDINDPGLFEKKSGVPLGAELSANVGKDTFAAPKIEFRLAQVTIDGEASGKTAGGATTIDFKAHSNQVDLAKLGELSPLVGKYGVNGLVELSVHAEGPTDKIGYGANVKFNKIVLNNEALKQPLEVNGSLAVVTNELKSLVVKLTAPKGFDLALDGSLQNFMAPKFKFNLASSELDLDGLLKASEKAAQTRKEHAEAAMSGQASGGGDKGGPASSPVVDYDAMLAPLHKIPMAAAAAGTFDFNLRKVKSTGVSIDNIQGQLALNNLLLALKDFSMKIFDGSIKGNMSFNARGAKPEVATNITLAGLQTQKMVESSMPVARNTIKGAISAALNIGGAGLNPPEIIAGWKGNGSFDVKDAVFSTLDVGTQLKEGVFAKLPPALNKLKIPEKALDKQGRYSNVGVKFAMSDGVMHVNDINGKAYPGEGFDLKGGGTANLSTYVLDMNVDIIDTYDIIPNGKEAKDSRYGHFALSAPLGGTLLAPKFNFAAALGRLVQNAAKSQLESRGKELLQKQLGNAGGGAAAGILGKVLGGGGGDTGGSSGGNNNNPPPAPKPADAAKNVLKGLGGLFGH